MTSLMHALIVVTSQVGSPAAAPAAVTVDASVYQDRFKCETAQHIALKNIQMVQHLLGKERQLSTNVVLHNDGWAAVIDSALGIRGQEFARLKCVELPR